VSEECSACGFAAACVSGTMRRPYMPVEGEMVRCVHCGTTWRIKTVGEHEPFDDAGFSAWIEKYEPLWLDDPEGPRTLLSWLGAIEPGCPQCRRGAEEHSGGLELLRCRVVSAYYGCFTAGIPLVPRHRSVGEGRRYNLVERKRRSWIWRA
jgi:hypothetical protein